MKTNRPLKCAVASSLKPFQQAVWLSCWYHSTRRVLADTHPPGSVLACCVRWPHLRVNLLSLCGSSAADVLIWHGGELRLTPQEETFSPEKRKVSLTIITILRVLTRCGQAGNSLDFLNFFFTAVYLLQYLVATHGAGSASIISKYNAFELCIVETKLPQMLFPPIQVFNVQEFYQVRFTCLRCQFTFILIIHTTVPAGLQMIPLCTSSPATAVSLWKWRHDPNDAQGVMSCRLTFPS